MLHTVILQYTLATKKLIPGGRPDLVDRLSGYDYSKPEEDQREMVEQAVVKACLSPEILFSEEARFIQFYANKGITLPTIDEFVQDTFMPEMVTKAMNNVFEGNGGFNAYKADTLALSKEEIWDRAYSIDLANQIAYFFETIEENSYLSESEYASVINIARTENFFSNIFEFAQNRTDFNTSDLYESTKSIVAYCELVELTPEDFKAGMLKNV